MPDDFWLILHRVAHTSVRLSGVRGMSYRVISSGVTIRAVDFSKCSGIEEFPGNCWSFTLPFCCGFAPVSYRERDFKTVLSGSGNRKYLTQIFDLLCRLNHLNWNYFCTKGFCSIAFAKSEAVWLCEASTKQNNPSNLADLFILCCILGIMFWLLLGVKMYVNSGPAWAWAVYSGLLKSEIVLSNLTSAWFLTTCMPAITASHHSTDIPLISGVGGEVLTNEVDLP